MCRVSNLLRAWARERIVLKDAVGTAIAMAVARGHENTEKNPFPREAGGEDVLDDRGAGALALLGRVELCVVAGSVASGAGKVVGHEVDEVDVLLDTGKVDVVEGPLVGGEGHDDHIFFCGKVEADRCEEGEEVAALLCVTGVLPVD